ncbi:GalNAc-alpha-(1-_4)-GalNAc-alpha-(1-_3)-diNAcBac-PP-undecaprenol alpha-1,4-N-acetyl-D-galactosaminyltransferase [Arenibacter palladensis]|uniref:GalNAc-alpha-(1->4)-GalNAc-alpha-(1->3)-diNAcBac-PP-undecaprenol alpha-1,4-N-acetyl-D-galactosaminyltransferase n=1 Tax=Arenibacter palladensis TaxID=237373 RepID=A0A1M5ELM3_9FLAO|nr:glycosyltransferase family 4 protein [Arenibacter palladensis]SHF79981.1 GalNAc-alpha-(1->4)-GalNAc-alpha-(1->3)-diNAcBac-PP-undecaprenol alpha-1,4-N-acetyl-D-galactosaminyltransferase [Arenibacter palladensis]
MHNKVEKQKIAFVIPSLGAGGAERVVSTLANALINDYEVYIITFIKVVPFYKLHKDVQLMYCVDNVPPSRNIFNALKSNYILLKKINAIIKTEKIQLLIGFLTSANVLSVLAAKSNSIPSIISERNNPNKNNTNKFWKLLKNFSYPKANYLVVQTNKIKEYYTSSVDEKKLIILPNPISAELSAKRDNEAFKENVILNVGRLTNQKAQDVLIKSFSQIEDKNWKLLIIGEGPKKKEYQKLIEKLDLKDRVIIKSKTKNIDKYYNSSRIFAFSSIFEGFPNALIEAMHFGIPCISTDCPTGPSELIKDGINGFLIPMNKEQVLTEKINQLISKEDLRLSFGKNGQKTVDKFKVDSVVERWNKIIKRCI